MYFKLEYETIRKSSQHSTEQSTYSDANGSLKGFNLIRSLITPLIDQSADQWSAGKDGTVGDERPSLADPEDARRIKQHRF